MVFSRSLSFRRVEAIRPPSEQASECESEWLSTKNSSIESCLDMLLLRPDLFDALPVLPLRAGWRVSSGSPSSLTSSRSWVRTQIRLSNTLSVMRVLRVHAYVSKKINVCSNLHCNLSMRISASLNFSTLQYQLHAETRDYCCSAKNKMHDYEKLRWMET